MSINVDVARLIAEERDSQDEKWGVQDHPDGRWLAILIEEVGEAAAAMLETNAPDDERLAHELTQVAAVAVAWMESLDRRALERKV